MMQAFMHLISKRYLTFCNLSVTLTSMKYDQLKKLRIVVLGFLTVFIVLALVYANYLLAVVGILTGILFLTIVRSKRKIKMDEREMVIGEKAARMTYIIFSPTIGLAALLFLLLARGEFHYMESLGFIFAYLALFLIILYTLSYHFLNGKFGGHDKEE